MQEAVFPAAYRQLLTAYWLGQRQEKSEKRTCGSSAEQRRDDA